MNFTRKIYYNDKPLVLTTDKEVYINDHPAAEEYFIMNGADVKSFSQAIQQMDKPGARGAIIEDASPEALIEQLQVMYQPIDAGGGLVYNEHGEVLMIFRRGKWDLPKGKLDEGEDIEACALREVTEETGLSDLQLGKKICDTYHIYSQNGEHLLKHTAWYTMQGSSAQKLKPQKAENIMEARWVAQKDLAPLVGKSYEAIREVIRAAGLQW
jgi:ADP-ribose pyrophosphatase YjhB (NUDIX family)